LHWKNVNDLWKYIIDSFQKQRKVKPAEIESYLTGQLIRYIENCLWDCPNFPWIFFHELDKLLVAQLRYRLQPVEVCEADMQTRIFAAIETQFGEYLSTTEDFYGYHIVKRPPLGDYVPDEIWMVRRSHVLAMEC
jgi:hypothetical protein